VSDALAAPWLANNGVGEQHRVKDVVAIEIDKRRRNTSGVLRTKGPCGPDGEALER
jgi:hypothetical protein